MKHIYLYIIATVSLFSYIVPCQNNQHLKKILEDENQSIRILSNKNSQMLTVIGAKQVHTVGRLLWSNECTQLWLHILHNYNVATFHEDRPMHVGPRSTQDILTATINGELHLTRKIH